MTSEFNINVHNGLTFADENSTLSVAAQTSGAGGNLTIEAGAGENDVGGNLILSSGDGLSSQYF